MGNYLGKNSRSLRRRERRPSCTHTAAPVLGPRAVTPGVAANSGRWLTCVLLRAVQRRRVESLVLGALSSSPVHRALVLVLGTNIAVLLDCSKSSRQCSLPYLLTTYVRISVGISFPRCLARCAPSILSTLLRQYFSLNCRRPPLDQGGWSSESVSHGCIGHDTEADWHQSAPGTPERRLLALEVILD